MGDEFYGEKIIFPSAPVPSINNDQSLNLLPAPSSEYYRKSTSINGGLIVTKNLRDNFLDPAQFSPVIVR